MSKTDCFLDSLDLDVVTESDHQNNYCFCSRCTCGKHVCPKPQPKQYPKSTFSSYYKMNYKRHSILQKPRNPSAPHVRSIFKFDSETTSSHDYRPYAIETNGLLKTEKSPAERSLYKISTSSIYRQDFANWGHIKTESTKPVPLHYNSGVKFNGLSTYAACFTSSPTATRKIIKQKDNTNILCSGKSAKTPETTMKSSYNTYKSAPSQAIHRADNTVLLPAFQNQYATVNSINYDPKDIIATIRRARRNFD